jgi:CHAT domain-containing protein
LRAEHWQALHLQARSLLWLRQDDAAGQLAAQADALLASLTDPMSADERSLYMLSKATVQEETLLMRVAELQCDTAALRTARGLNRLTGRLRLLRRVDALLGMLDGHRDGSASLRAGGGVAVGLGPGLLIRLLRMSAKQAQLAFVALPDRLVVVWSTWLHLGYSVVAITRMELREHVRRWHEHARFALDAHRQSPEAAAAHTSTGASMLAEIAQRLQLDDLLAALPKAVERLVLMPDDVLHGLPFAALPHCGEPLVRRYALSCSFHSRSLAARANAAVTRALVTGVASAAGERPLKEVALECETIAAWLNDCGVTADLLVESDATCDAVTARLADVDLAHLACHGVFVPDRPDRSGLLLAPGADDDGVLTLQRLATLRLQRCRHVTLSACWSADSFVLPGRRIFSLPEALLRGGVGSVLGSLWPVVDEVSAPFMQRFHAALFRVPLDLALREAQLVCLAAPQTAAPIFWAGFVLHGDPRRLQFRR